MVIEKFLLVLSIQAQTFDFQIDFKSLSKPSDLENLYNYKNDPVIFEIFFYSSKN